MSLAALRNATIRDTTGKSADLRVLSTKLVDGRLKVLDTATWTERYEKYEPIRVGIAEGLLYAEKPGAISVQNLLHRSQEDDKKLGQAMHITSLIKLRMKQHGVTKNKAYSLLVMEEADHAGADTISLPSKPTVYRYLSREEKGLPPLVGDSEKGNRTDRYTRELRELVVEEAEDLYLKEKSQWTLKALIAHISTLARDRNLIPNDKNLSRKYVRSVIYEDCCSDDEKARMDQKDVASGKSIASKTIRLATPLQRVEQDGLHLPFIAKTPWGISGDIWLVQAMDCHLSIPVGWKIVIGSPKGSDSLACFERVMFPKKNLIEAMGINCDIDLYGTPFQVIFDNGPENKAPRMLNLTRLGIKPMYCKSRHAHGKPFIERLNRSLKVALETLPGCTRFNGVDGKRDPIAEGDQLMDLYELEKWIVRWFFEVWIHTPLKRLRSAVFVDSFKGHTPAQVWKRLIVEEEHALPLPPNLRDWQLVKFEQADCALSSKSGITLKTFTFAGDNLKRLIDAFGSVDVRVLFDPDDFRFVYVAHGGDLVKLINKFVDDRTPGYSFDRAKEIRDDVPLDDSGRLQSEAYMRDVYAFSAARTRAATTRKTSTRVASKETKGRAREHSATMRAAQDPLTSRPEAPEQAVDTGQVLWSKNPSQVFEVSDATASGTAR
jgi:putative transposase